MRKYKERLTTVPHESYITPNNTRILEVAKEQEIKGSFGSNLTKDLSNMFSHYDAKQSSASYYGLGYGASGNKFDPSEAMIPYDELKGTTEDKVKQQKLQDFLKKIPYHQYQGKTPAHKAMQCLQHLSSMVGRDGEGEKGGEEVDWLSDLITERQDLSEMAQKLVDTKEAIDNLSEFQRECLSTEDDLKNFKIPFSTFKQLEILSLLKDIKAIKTQGSRTKVKDNRGKHRVNMRMSQISDVSRVKKVNMLLPNFEIKLATKEFFISEKIRKEDKKQILFYMEDDSGSMAEPYKEAFCNAVLLNRCEAVARGEAELVFYSYERKKYNRHHITTREEAMKFYHNHKDRNRCGGPTGIGGIIGEAIDEIKSMDGVKPEIMIVCDGQDHVEKVSTKGVKVHSFIIGTKNEGLRDLCVSSGGVYVYQDCKND